MANLKRDLTTAGAVTLLGVPQGIAYALIAGLPPVAGLYATAVPAIVGSLFRSSSQVATGPTNALSLLVGGALMAGSLGPDPVATALVMAFLVGVFQIAAGVLRLGSMVDYISRAVVLGYITGAGLLIGFGQLGHLTGTEMARGDPWTRFASWTSGLGATDPRSIALALGTVAGMLAIRRYAPKIPATVVALGGGIALSWLFDFRSLGLAVAGDLSPVPRGLPPFAIPDLSWEVVQRVAPAAFAASVLSLVESSSVARSLSAQTGQRIDMNREFVGSGLANLSAGLMGGYPVSGSLSRSAVLAQGHGSRWAGVLSGVFMILVLLLLGPVVDLTPIASLAGLLILVAHDLVDVSAIRSVMRSLLGDKLAFLGTLIGTWTLPLDTAIYLGVGISIVLFLRRVGNLRVRDLVLTGGKFREVDMEEAVDDGRCPNIRILHVEGNLFFGAANELQDAIDEATRDARVLALVIRLKRARGLDYTTAGVLMASRARLASTGRHLILAGMTPKTMELFDDIGLVEAFGTDALFPTKSEWFVAMGDAVARARALVGKDHLEHDCPIDGYLASR